jgi:hypothetical protein
MSANDVVWEHGEKRGLAGWKCKYCLKEKRRMWCDEIETTFGCTTFACDLRN